MDVYDIWIPQINQDDLKLFSDSKGKVRKPLSNYFVFLKHNVKRIVDVHPEVAGSPGVRQLVAAVWKNLPREVKQAYDVYGQKLIQLHKKKYPSYWRGSSEYKGKNHTLKCPELEISSDTVDYTFWGPPPEKKAKVEIEADQQQGGELIVCRLTAAQRERNAAAENEARRRRKAAEALVRQRVAEAAEAAERIKNRRLCARARYRAAAAQGRPRPSPPVASAAAASSRPARLIAVRPSSKKKTTSTTEVASPWSPIDEEYIVCDVDPASIVMTDTFTDITDDTTNTTGDDSDTVITPDDFAVAELVPPPTTTASAKAAHQQPLTPANSTSSSSSSGGDTPSFGLPSPGEFTQLCDSYLSPNSSYYYSSSSSPPVPVLVGSSLAIASPPVHAAGCGGEQQERSPSYYYFPPDDKMATSFSSLGQPYTYRAAATPTTQQQQHQQQQLRQGGNGYSNGYSNEQQQQQHYLSFATPSPCYDPTAFSTPPCYPNNMTIAFTPPCYADMIKIEETTPKKETSPALSISDDFMLNFYGCHGGDELEMLMKTPPAGDDADAADADRRTKVEGGEDEGI